MRIRRRKKIALFTLFDHKPLFLYYPNCLEVNKCSCTRGIQISDCIIREMFFEKKRNFVSTFMGGKKTCLYYSIFWRKTKEQFFTL